MPYPKYDQNKDTNVYVNAFIIIPKTKKLSSLSLKPTPSVFKGFAFDKWILYLIQIWINTIKP